MENSKIILPKWRMSVLPASAQRTIEIGDEMRLTSGSICYADVTVSVDYRIPLLPITWHGATFRYYTEMRKSGRMVWRTEPLRL